VRWARGALEDDAWLNKVFILSTMLMSSRAMRFITVKTRCVVMMMQEWADAFEAKMMMMK
jgi:hypothetical protein